MIEEDKHWYLFFATEQGLVKRVDISEFENIRQTGKIAIKLKEDDSLVGVKLTKGDDEILIAASNGKLVRFSEVIDVQLRTSEHRSMYSYVRLSIDRCTATYV